MKKAIFLDVDGTILDSFHGCTEMTPEVAKAIRQLQQNGDYVFIATGRPYAFMSHYLQEFGFDGFILSNGAQIVLKDQTIFKEHMDQEAVKTITQAFDELGIQYILEGERYSYMKNASQKFYDFFESLGIDKKMIKGEYDLDQLEVFKIEALCSNKALEEKCFQIMSDFPEYEAFFSIKEILFEIHAKKNTKGTGILKTLELLGIPIENSFAFGDGCNDIEMLKTVGCGIAMGNASDEVKAHADHVTAPVSEDGVAVGIEKYIL